MAGCTTIIEKALPAKIKLLVLEPDLKCQQRLITCLSGEPGFRIVGVERNFLALCYTLSPDSPVDVLLIDLDHQAAITEMKTWAAIHALLPYAQVVALTEKADALALEAALGARVTALHWLDAGAAVLRQAIWNAAHGIVDYDPCLIEKAKQTLPQSLKKPYIYYDGLAIDLETREVACQDRRIRLTPLEHKVLTYLAHNEGKLVSSNELLEAVWECPANNGGTGAQVWNCIKRIRQKIEPDANHPRYLRHVRGWGYVLQDPRNEPRYVRIT